MTVSIAVGSRFHFGSVLAAAKTMSAITNAAEAVATLEASHGIAVGDYLIVATSGWGLLAGRALRAKAVATNDVTLEGLDTQDTSAYPPGAGAGTVQEVSTWTELTQIATIETSGGEQNFADASSIVDVDDREIPTSRTPTRYVFNVHDDNLLPWYSIMRQVADALLPRPLRITMRDGSKWLANGYFTFNDNPRLARDTTTRVQVTFSASARPIRYAT
jgi:hypothetical protein